MILFWLLNVVLAQSDVSAEALCAACKAVVNEVEKKLTGFSKKSKRGEGDVIAAIESICNVDHFRTYDYAPPRMLKACERLIENDAALEQLFVRKLPPTEIEQQFCFGPVTKSCVGVDMSKKPKADGPRIMQHGINGLEDMDFDFDSFGDFGEDEPPPMMKPAKAKNPRAPKRDL
jgi:hypothetical protein